MSRVLWFVGRILFVLALAGTTGVANADDVTFDLKVEGGRVPQSMRLIRVKQGDSVKLRFTSDRRIILHLHGYDIEKEIKPGAVGAIAFNAHATGRFSIETHITSSTGHAHEPPLVRIEVYPR